ncbi:MAG TPA: DUF2459 domain-containing protein [Verrucomicrobiales bacterium]|nr:DUF2459 domain-containing protein [Verrucomicrobiales bacterium]
MHRCLFPAFALFFCVSCTAPHRSSPALPVYVIYSGFIHSSIAVRKADIPPGSLPASDDFPRARFIEAGWGDEKCFREELTSGKITKALLFSCNTALRYDASIYAPGGDLFDPEATIVEIRVTPEGMARLCAFMAKTHARDSMGRSIRLAENWYRGRGLYCALHTCNNWVADALRAAGCTIVPGICQLPRSLMWQVRKLGRVIDVRTEFPVPQAK